MRGWKVFDKNLQCRGFQFEVGKTYTEEKAILCVTGFHFHENSSDLFNYYNYPNRICEVECDGVITGDDKSVCTKITIVKELTSEEILTEILTVILDIQIPEIGTLGI